MERRKRVRLVGIIVGMFVLASFMTDLLGMALSEKNREYFVYRLKNIRQLPLFKPTNLPEKTNESEVGYLLIFASRLLEVFGFLMTLLFIFKGVALKYVFITAGLTASGILISLFGFISGKISAIQSFAIESVFAGFILALGFYAFMEKREEKLRPPKPPPKGTRCPVCMGFVKEDHYCVAREGRDLYYFDEE